MSATVWFKGTLVNGTLAVDPGDRGFLLGDGLFETIAVFNGSPIWLTEHLDRMLAGAALLGIPADRASIAAAVAETLRAGAHRHGILRITLTRGAGVRGLAANGAEPSLLVTANPWVKGTLFAPATLFTSTIRRNETSPVSRLKTLSYMDNILAVREAAAAQCDDALFLNTRGEVAATTIANIFIRRGGRLATPPLSAGILPGIARQKLLSLTQAVEREIAPSELHDAEAVFLTNSLRLVRPVHALDGRALRHDDAALARYFEHLCTEIVRESGLDPREADAL
ncbi:class IV aminotransferase [Nordella sp. HKS 07]|uniref:aminotransferase class IV n=1 Tax=Nordella sp. HKS 07 TaxID=2712222 RepID=UPI0013E1471A|nr:aminotransferase class IV [Nordella sp. HKS 07]QIG47943.1 class IV aminotransferase [Nordella sp. HKS 07]